MQYSVIHVFCNDEVYYERGLLQNILLYNSQLYKWSAKNYLFRTWYDVNAVCHEQRCFEKNNRQNAWWKKEDLPIATDRGGSGLIALQAIAIVGDS